MSPLYYRGPEPRHLRGRGRGELQLGVLIETMRREGFELAVSRPRVLYRESQNSASARNPLRKCVDVDDEFAGVVVEFMSFARRG